MLVEVVGVEPASRCIWHQKFVRAIAELFFENYELNIRRHIHNSFRKNRRLKIPKAPKTELEYMTPFNNRSSASYDDGYDITIIAGRLSR